MTTLVPAPIDRDVADRYTIISSDCHAGANHATYREYLTKEWQEEFDAWRGKYANPFRDLQDDGRSRNWDDERRVADLHADGIVAEVTFPNTVPPFFPTGAVIAAAPTPDNYERRLVGIRAHNRWLVDFCNERPGQRAGLAQIFLNDVDDAVADIHWAKEHGLHSILLPAVAPNSHLAPLYAPEYDPVWRACEQTGLPVTAHSGGTGMPNFGKYPIANLVFVLESSFYSNRSLWHLLMSGVFERFPTMKFAMTEQGSAWVPDLLDRLDNLHEQMVRDGRIGELGLEADVILPLKPSDYFRRQVYIGASFPSPSDAAVFHDIGLDHVMWGSDYPHHEACWPYSRESLRRTFAGWSEADLRQVLAGTAASVYGFDLDLLAPIAADVGPTVAEVATPLDEIPADATSPSFHRN